MGERSGPAGSPGGGRGRYTNIKEGGPGWRGVLRATPPGASPSSRPHPPHAMQAHHARGRAAAAALPLPLPPRIISTPPHPEEEQQCRGPQRCSAHAAEQRCVGSGECGGRQQQLRDGECGGDEGHALGGGGRGRGRGLCISNSPPALPSLPPSLPPSARTPLPRSSPPSLTAKACQAARLPYPSEAALATDTVGDGRSRSTHASSSAHGAQGMRGQGRGAMRMEKGRVAALPPSTILPCKHRSWEEGREGASTAKNMGAGAAWHGMAWHGRSGGTDRHHKVFAADFRTDGSAWEGA